MTTNQYNCMETFSSQQFRDNARMEERMVSNAAGLVGSYPALHFFVRPVVPLNGSAAAAPTTNRTVSFSL